MNKKVNFLLTILGFSLSFNALAAILDQGVSSVANTANTQLGNISSAASAQINQAPQQIVQQMPILQSPSAIAQQAQNASQPTPQEQIMNQATQNALQQQTQQNGQPQNQSANQLQSVLQPQQVQPSQLQTADNQSGASNQLNANLSANQSLNNQTADQKLMQPTPGIPASQLVTTPTELLPHYCPLEIELNKVGNTWMSGKNWKDDNVSIVKQIGNFTGAQWVGVNIGSIICLYRGKNAFDFPIALRQIHSQQILEPKTSNWSAVVTNYKLCKSSNVKDCPFFVKPEENVQNAYKEIDYNPANKNDLQ